MKESGYDSEERNGQNQQADETSGLHEDEREMLLSRSQKHRAASRSTKDERSVEQIEEKVPTDTDNVQKERKKKPWWALTTFWFFRKAIAPVIMIVMLLAGLYIGYVIIGGQSGADVFRLETWRHLWDLIFADT